MCAIAEEPPPHPAPAQTGASTLIIQEGLSSSSQSEASSRHDSAEGTRAKILHLWFARKAALDAADPVEAQARVEELRAYMQDEGITADRTIARGFAYGRFDIRSCDRVEFLDECHAVTRPA